MSSEKKQIALSDLLKTISSNSNHEINGVQDSTQIENGLKFEANSANDRFSDDDYQNEVNKLVYKAKGTIYENALQKYLESKQAFTLLQTSHLNNVSLNNSKDDDRNDKESNTSLHDSHLSFPRNAISSTKINPVNIHELTESVYDKSKSHQKSVSYYNYPLSEENDYEDVAIKSSKRSKSPTLSVQDQVNRSSQPLVNARNSSSRSQSPNAWKDVSKNDSETRRRSSKSSDIDANIDRSSRKHDTALTSQQNDDAQNLKIKNKMNRYSDVDSKHSSGVGKQINKPAFDLSQTNVSKFCNQNARSRSRDSSRGSIGSRDSLGSSQHNESGKSNSRSFDKWLNHNREWKENVNMKV